MKKLISQLICSGLLITHIGVFAAAPPIVGLSSTPLYSGGGNVHPNLLLNLSVEFPTVKAAYNNASDYNKSIDYIGYFNFKKCYVNGTTKTYSKDKSGGAIAPRVAGYSDMTNGYFSILKDADTNHECGGDSFSGNFMNWASSSSIDMLRLALTGGDRVIDSSTQTVLQRAFLYSGFYNSGGYFRRKIVSVSATMSAPKDVTPFDASTLYVTNCDNKILFSDSNASGSCAPVTRTLPTNTSADSWLDITTDRDLGEYL
ncbi:MAG: hypothetical protein NTY70_07425, partial [Burkholderiales bacterium]|nr:hypothetical protein [Burkholderiales bacterium]